MDASHDSEGVYDIQCVAHGRYPPNGAVKEVMEMILGRSWWQTTTEHKTAEYEPGTGVVIVVPPPVYILETGKGDGE